MGSFCATAANKRQHVNSNTQLIHVGDQSIWKTSVSSTTKITTYSPPANQEQKSASTSIPCVAMKTQVECFLLVFLPFGIQMAIILLDILLLELLARNLLNQEHQRLFLKRKSHADMLELVHSNRVWRKANKMMDR